MRNTPQQPPSGPRSLGTQIQRFALSGLLGLAVDTAVLYGLMALGGSFALARGASFLAAATFTWAFNRRLTFNAAQPRPPSWGEWLHYLFAMAFGGAVNYAVSLGAYHGLPVVQVYPVLALVLGSGAGMVINFFSARHWVFRPPR